MKKQIILNTKYIFFTCIFYFLIYTCALATQTNNLVFKNKKYFIKGICYNPSYPKNGGGAVIFKYLPNNIKEKDFMLMKEAGINTIRVYEPMLDEFYDYTMKYDLKVIEQIISPGSGTNIRNEKAVEEYIRLALDRVREMKNHPSILMWSLWNDAPFENNIVKKYGLKRVNDFFKKIYDAIKKEDPVHPITAANRINVNIGYDMGFEFLDVIGCNAYLGFDYSSNSWEKVIFSRSFGRKTVKDLKRISKRYKKPVLITETGSSTLHHYKKQDSFIKKQLKLIGENIAGVCIFEWNDEWWKAGNIAAQDNSVEEHWGVVTGFRDKKPGYDIIKNIFTKTNTESNGFKSNLFQK